MIDVDVDIAYEQRKLQRNSKPKKRITINRRTKYSGQGDLSYQVKIQLHCSAAGGGRVHETARIAGLSYHTIYHILFPLAAKFLRLDFLGYPRRSMVFWRCRNFQNEAWTPQYVIDMYTATHQSGADPVFSLSRDSRKHCGLNNKLARIIYTFCLPSSPKRPHFDNAQRHSL